MSIALDHTATTARPWPGAGAYATASEDMARMRRELLDQTASEGLIARALADRPRDKVVVAER